MVSVEGRTFPVEVRYRPLEEQGVERGDSGLETADGRERSTSRASANHDARIPTPDLTVNDAIVAAVDEITREDARGDVLIFLPGEREIRDAHQA
ncbi:HrpA-like RNA helicase, partial [Pseudoxanthomonas winnipegensis]|nr:HrpA-like RNA helicase [Pseudoxanthomonas winnipegensis]